MDLATLVKKKGNFNEIQIWQLLEDLLPALKLIHADDIIHGDIKPANIVQQPKANFVLVGLTTTTLADPEYAAPELIQGKPVFASDLYSLGVTCLYLLTQISPFDLFDATNDRWVWQDYLTSKISLRLAQILDQLVQHNVTHRFQSVDQVMEVMGIQFHQPNLKSEILNCIFTLNQSSAVNSIAVSPDGITLASGDDDKTVKLWDLETKQLKSILFGHSQAIKSVAFSSDGKILATASDDKTIKLWNVDSQAEIYTLVGHSHAVKSIAFSPDGQFLASGSWDKTIKLWQLSTGKEIYTVIGHQLQVTAVAFNPLERDLIASASFDRTVRLWELPTTNRPYRQFCGHTWAVLAVAFSPDGKMLATGSDDNTIKLWDISTSELVVTLQGHCWPVTSVTFSINGELLISGSRDKTIKLWRVSTMKEIATFAGHTDSVSSVIISSGVGRREAPVTQLMISGSRDKTIKLWEFGQ